LLDKLIKRKREKAQINIKRWKWWFYKRYYRNAEDKLGIFLRFIFPQIGKIWRNGQKLHDHLHRCRKSLCQIQHPFMTKILKSTRNRKSRVPHNKGYLLQTCRQHCTEWRKTEDIYFKIRNKIRVSTFPTLIQYSS
jgi:hypothetical protein